MSPVERRKLRKWKSDKNYNMSRNEKESDGIIEKQRFGRKKEQQTRVYLVD